MKTFLDGRVTLHGGDCLDVVRGLADNSIDSVVTDPPYALVSIVNRFGNESANRAISSSQKRYGKDGIGGYKPVLNEAGNPKDQYSRLAAGFMGQKWDNGSTAFAVEFWAEILRVLKPGGHVAAFGGTRSYHRLACAIEDAGFEIRDQLAWCYGTGFPKSHDVSKGIDKAAPRVGMFSPFAAHYAERRAAAGLTHNQICEVGKFYAEHNHGGASSNWEKGCNVPTLAQWTVLQTLLGLSNEWVDLIERVEAEREKVGEKTSGIANSAEGARHTIGASSFVIVDITAPATDAARQWEGWGTALKPAWEPICLARRPLSERTVAANILKWGVGALNIGGCRIHANDDQGERGDGEEARRQCAVHGVRVMQENDARLEVQTEEGKTADQLQRGMPRELDESGAESELRQERLVRHSHGLSEVESRQASSIGYRPPADADAEGLFGTSNGDGATLGPRSSSGGECPPYQWEQAGQHDREPNADRLDITRSGARADRAVDDGASKGKRDAASCTCGKVATGRWPANLAHDGSDEVLAAFPESKDGVAVQRNGGGQKIGGNGIYGGSEGMTRPDIGFGGKGSAARFFYSAKASKADRALSKHPTVKPVKLMQWLVRLITPPGGTTLDPFSGTGTTGEAAWREGFSAVLIEREEEYQADIERRMLFAKARPKTEPKQHKRDCDPGTLDMFPLESSVACDATIGAEQ